MRIASFIAGCLVAGTTTLASAQEPVRLYDHQLDEVVAAYGGFGIATISFGLLSSGDVSATFREDAVLSSVSTQTNNNGRITTRVNASARQTGSVSASSSGFTAASLSGGVRSFAFR